jgi:hypothetical protein
MTGTLTRSESLFYYFRLEDHVPVEQVERENVVAEPVQTPDPAATDEKERA